MPVPAACAAVRAVEADPRTYGGADVVVGFGGYVAAPAYLAARRRLGVPIVVHEANARPGLANRLGARMSRHVGVGDTRTVAAARPATSASRCAGASPTSTGPRPGPRRG